MWIDELGFIHPLEEKPQDYFAKTQIYYKIDKEPSLKTKVNEIRKIRNKNNCWICEGWREIEFKFVIPHNYENPNPEKPNSVKIHLSCDDYKPTDMIHRKDQNFYICNRMCPPGEIEFFFTLNTEVMYYPSKDAPLIHLNDPFVYHIVINNEEEDDVLIERTVHSLQRQNIQFNGYNVDPSYMSLLKYCHPRPEKKKVVQARPRTPWVFPISIWAAYDYAYEGDSEEYLDQVFEHDFGRISKTKDGKVNEDYLSCETLLRSYFRKIIDTYKYYSSLNNSAIWQFSQTCLGEFCNLCNGLVDPQQYDFNFVLLRETEVKAIDKEEKRKNNNKNIPDNLIRHQFLNLLIRVAKDKYVRTKIKPNLFEAVKDSFTEHYLYALTFEHHQWRQERYYNEYVDNFLKAHLPYFNAIFYSYAKKKDPSEKERWMILDEFTALCLDIVDQNDFPVREIPLLFNYSIKLQISEITSDRHYNMFFPEFLEAFCRVIDKYSPIPFDQQKEDWTRQMRDEQHLSVKLENILPMLPKLIKNPEFKNVKDKFYFPGKDEETGLFKIDLLNPFYHQINKIPKKLYVDRKVAKKKLSILGTSTGGNTPGKFGTNISALKNILLSPPK